MTTILGDTAHPVSAMAARTRSSDWTNRLRGLIPVNWTAQQKRFLAYEAVVLFVASPFVVAGMNVLNDRYWIGHDPSDASCLPWHWMIVRRVSEPTMRQWRKGEVVVISASRMAPYVKDGTPIGKFISATAGDHVAIRSDGIFVNGDATPVGYLHADAIRRADAHLKAKTVGDDERAIPDRRVESFYREIVVGDGELFILGATPRSQDSRYFGVQRVENIRGVSVAPLW